MKDDMNKKFVTIQGWMVNDLKLKGNELMIYAIIYGFCQEENQVFYGSLNYIANWISSSKQTVIKCLKSLTDKNLIEKNEKFINNVKFCEYRPKNFDRGSQKSLIGVVKKFDVGSQKSLPNNIEDNIINKYNSNNNKGDEENKKNLYDLLQENGFILSPIHYEEVSKWEDNDLTRYVIEETVLKNIYNIKYISTVLSAYKRKNIRTIEQAKEEEEHFRQKPKQEKKKDSFDEILRQFVEEGENEDDQTRS